MKQGRNDEAIRAYQRAMRCGRIQLTPTTSSATRTFLPADSTKQLTLISKPRSLRPKDGEAHYNLALAYIEIGDREAAMAQSRLLASIDAELNKKLLSEMRR